MLTPVLISLHPARAGYVTMQPGLQSAPAVGAAPGTFFASVNIHALSGTEAFQSSAFFRTEIPVKALLTHFARQHDFQTAMTLYADCLISLSAGLPLDERAAMISDSLRRIGLVPRRVGIPLAVDGETEVYAGRQFDEVASGVFVGTSVGAYRESSLVGHEITAMLRDIFSKVPDDAFHAAVLSHFDHGVDDDAYAYYLSAATCNHGIEARKYVVREATAHISDAERRRRILVLVSSFIHQDERRHVNFLQDITFQPHNPRCGRITFSRGSQLYVSLNDIMGVALGDTRYLVTMFSGLDDDALMVVPAASVPAAITSFLDAASRTYNELCPQFAPLDFTADLNRLCDFVGFATFIGMQDGAGPARPLTGMALQPIAPFETSAAQAKGGEHIVETAPFAELFGDFFRRMAGRSIIVALYDEGVLLHDTQAAALVAHEVGHLKFVSMMREADLPVQTFSDDAHEFFAHAYMGNYMLALYLWGGSFVNDAELFQIYVEVFRRADGLYRGLEEGEKSQLNVRRQEMPGTTIGFLDVHLTPRKRIGEL